jgi:glycosyltransferase involved in cell wall biosynthesis
LSATERKKIIYVSNFGDVRGGGEISLLNLLEKIDRSRFEPVLILPERGGMEKYASELDIPVRFLEVKPLKHPAAPLRLASAIGGYSAIFNEEKADIVHVNATARRALSAGVAAKISGIPAILHVRIIDSDGIADRILATLYTRVIANSKATAGRFAAIKSEDSKVTVIHNPVDLNKFRMMPANKDVRMSLGAGEGDILAGVVGWLHEFKGHKYFIDAATRLTDKENIKFVIVGDGPLRAELEAQASADPAAKNIRFAGHRSDMTDVMNALDILVLPSLREHFGRVLIEAMACGKPVVATNAGGVPEIVIDGETGLLVPPRDPIALASAIGRLAEDSSLRESMGRSGAERAARLFSSERHAELVQNIYLEL